MFLKGKLSIFLILLLCSAIELAPTKKGARQRVSGTRFHHNSKNHPYGVHTNIIKFNRENMMEVDFESLKILLHPEVASRKIVVVSVVGAFRKGKSFLLDYCLRYMYANYKSLNLPTTGPASNPDWMGSPDTPLTGFSWAGGKDRNTRGIAIWSDIFLHEANGEKLAIILMDTQGLFDNRTPLDTNLKIFALNSLLSSLLIFNLSDLIQENQLEYLKMSTSYAKLISETDGVSEVATDEKPFQDLLFLVRDYVHTEDHSYGLEGGNEYIREVLRVDGDERVATDSADEADNDNPAEQSESLKSVRKYIFDTFEKVSGFLMPHPGSNVTSLPNFDGRWSMLDDNFRTQLIDLIEWMLAPENLKVKKVFGQELTAAVFYDYVQAYCEGFNTPEVPEFQLVFDIMGRQQVKAYVNEALALYKKHIAQFSDPTVFDFHAIFQNEHENGKAMALNVYGRTRKMVNAAVEREYEEKLEKLIDEHFAKLKADPSFSRKIVNNLYWQSWSINQVNTPDDAVQAGVDADDTILYVIRARKECNIYPGKYSAQRKYAWISHEDQEIYMRTNEYKFELLRGENYAWLSNGNDGSQHTMYEAGNDCNDWPFYICRGEVQGITTPGRFQNGNCVISYGNVVHTLSDNFEILYV